MGIGSARGDDRAVQAAELAISSPLLEASIDGAHGVLLSIQGGSDLGLFEINEAARLVQEAAHPEANIIFGAVIDDALGDEVRVTVIAAGFDSGGPEAPPRPRAALGQVAGGQRGRARRRRRSPVPAPAAGPAAHARGCAAQQPRPGAERPDAPRAHRSERHARSRRSSPRSSTSRRRSTRLQRVEVPRIFEDDRRRAATEDLDVPDFLK